MVADTQWNATQAAAALDVTWSDPATLPDQATLYTWMQQQPSADSYTVNSGDTDQMLKGAVTKVSAQYLHPYQMHGSLACPSAVAGALGCGAAAVPAPSQKSGRPLKASIPSATV